MPFRLRNITFKRKEVVSLVDKGASGDKKTRPDVLLCKRKRGEGMGILEYLNKVLAREASEKALAELEKQHMDEQLEQLAKQFHEKIKEAVAKGQDPAAVFVEALEATSSLNDEQRAHFKALFMAALQAAPPPVAPEAPAVPAPPPEPEPTEPAPPMDDGKQAEDEPDMDEMQKTQEAQKRLETEVTELRKEVADYREREEVAEQREVAKRFSAVPGDIEERAKKLASLKKKAPDEYEFFVEELRKADELAKRGLRQTGTSRCDGETDDEQRFEAEVQKVFEEGKGTVTRQQAFAKAAETHEDLYKRAYRSA